MLDLGETPLADRLLRREQLEQPEPKFPLEVVFCSHCGLMQILETVPPFLLFCDEYPYYSSFSQELLEHSRTNARELIKERRLGARSMVVEIASNDGYLLKNYVNAGIPVLGIDPAEGPAREAEKAWVPTINQFFTYELAEELVGNNQMADVIHANNVLAHVADTNGFVKGLGRLLKNDGVAVIEAPYVRDLIEHCEFDTIYHEHLCYFSVTSANHLFRQHGLFLNRVKWMPIHGGSMRYYVEKRERVDDSVRSMLAEEVALGVNTLEYYRDFSQRVETIREQLRAMLDELKGQGKRIAAYGAAAKGSTLLNYIGIGHDTVEFVVDRNVHKQNKYMPGQHIPILKPEKILEQMPDYVLLLPWNFANEILSQQEAYRRLGGKFIIPIPTPSIV